MSSFLIKNVIIVDGADGKPFSGAVLVRDGVIASVDPSGATPVAAVGKRHVVDGGGLTLCPGFIDAHSHSDLSLLVEPDAFGKLSQGITTEVNGNCGLSPFPVTRVNRDHLEELYANYNVPLSWSSFAEYAAVMDGCRPGGNVVPLCGHNTLRAAVCGYGRTEITAEKLIAMQTLLHECLSAGAGGFSSGLLYIPGKFAAPDELVALLRTLRGFGRPYTTHLRSEGPRLLESLEEAIACSTAAGIPRLHISHLKTSGKANWHKLDAAIGMIDKARQSGLEITADRYPYTESMTQLSVILPPPYDDMDDISLARLLRDKTEQEKLLAALETLDPERWDTTRLVNTATTTYQEFLGLTINGIAARLALPPTRVCAEILTGDAAGTMAAFRGMNADNLERILRLPYVVCGTDETARPKDYRLGRSHPRGFGSFPEFYRQLGATMDIGAVIHKMTLLPATIFGLSGRGRIAPGHAADLVLFDPENFVGGADYGEPHIPADGVSRVFVNGIEAFADGRVITRAGRVLLQS